MNFHLGDKQLALLGAVSDDDLIKIRLRLLDIFLKAMNKTQERGMAMYLFTKAAMGERQ